MTSALSAAASAGNCAASTTADAPATAAAGDGWSPLSFPSSAAITASYCARERYAKSRTPACCDSGYFTVRPRVTPFHATVALASVNFTASNDGDASSDELLGPVAE